MLQRRATRALGFVLLAAPLLLGVPARGEDTPATAPADARAAAKSEQAAAPLALCPPAAKPAPAKKAKKKRLRKSQTDATPAAGAAVAAPAIGSAASVAMEPPAAYPICPPCPGAPRSGGFEALTFDPDFDSPPIAPAYRLPPTVAGWPDRSAYFLPPAYHAAPAVSAPIPAYYQPTHLHGPARGWQDHIWPEYGWPEYGWPEYGWPEYGWPEYGWPRYRWPEYPAPGYGWPGYARPGFGYPPPYDIRGYPHAAVMPAWYHPAAPAYVPWIERAAPAWPDHPWRWAHPAWAGHGPYGPLPYGW